MSMEEHTVGELICLPPRLLGSTIELDYRGIGRDGVATKFTETIKLPGSLEHVEKGTRDAVLRLLSLAASLSYFKAFAPGRIEVPAGLSTQERHFIDTLTKNGLGEFAYVNDLPEVFQTEIIAPPISADESRAHESETVRRVLVAVGGGKDSIVSIEGLKDAGFDVGLFSVNSYRPIEATAEVARIPLQSARRRLDPELFRLNEAGAPNGHVPVTAVNSLVAVLTAMALDYDTVAFSNEASSSYGNVEWYGHDVNHQWSKGIEFERLLRASLPAGAPTYVSLLRPLTELRIARRFATYREYHQVFTSCNRAFKLKESDRTSWCADCPKCRFVFLCLAPFMSRTNLLEIFSGRDMFADPKQTAGFLELLGADDLQKPFECVGEPDECRVALDLLRVHDEWKDHPFLSNPQVAALAVGASEHADVFLFREDEHFLSPTLEAVARAV
ncbi:hypothetical protein ACFP3Q_14455 [Nocardioides sp. GCM10027113]|uniref:hypothetical protein n=1 Tax=unclassified Nocardioides TaxID=2615069 RepID=UPI00361C6753